MAGQKNGVTAEITTYPAHAITSATGMVMVHAVSISRTTSHCTAFLPRVAPTPMLTQNRVETWSREISPRWMVTIDRPADLKMSKMPVTAFTMLVGVLAISGGRLVREPFIVRWPGKIQPGRVSNHLGYFPDVMPTLAELTGADCPKDTDGLSIVPELLVGI